MDATAPGAGSDVNFGDSLAEAGRLAEAAEQFERGLD
jgi:hypothetical protein